MATNPLDVAVITGIQRWDNISGRTKGRDRKQKKQENGVKIAARSQRVDSKPLFSDQEDARGCRRPKK
jgi:hypothetical protein